MNVKDLKYYHMLFNQNNTSLTNFKDAPSFITSDLYKNFIKNEEVLLINEKMAFEINRYLYMDYLSAERYFILSHDNRRNCEFFNYHTTTKSNYLQMVTSILLYNDKGILTSTNLEETHAYNAKQYSMIQGHVQYDEEIKKTKMIDIIIENMNREIQEEVKNDITNQMPSVDSNDPFIVIQTQSTASDVSHLCLLFEKKCTYIDKLTSNEEGSKLVLIPYEEIKDKFDSLCPWIKNALSSLHCISDHIDRCV